LEVLYILPLQQPCLGRGVLLFYPETQGKSFEQMDELFIALLSIGDGTDSRIYVTKDAAKTWTQAFTNEQPAAFLRLH
jgi:hypothetical protein